MSVRRSLGITGLAETATFLLSLLSAVVVSRLLKPDEIGVFSVAVSIIAFAHILRDFGVGQYLIQLPEITRERIRAAFTVMLVISWTMGGILFSLRHSLSTFYANENLAQVISLLSVNFLILPLGTHILSLLKREMQFGKVAIVSLTGTGIQVTVTISTALAGESYMSMAWGSVAGNICTILILSVIQPKYALLLPTWTGIQDVVRFGSKSSATSIIGELGASGPDLILGRTLGFDAVAFFSRAISLNNMVIARAVVVIRQVYFPAFAKGIREGADARKLYYQSISLMISVIAPLIVVLGLVADTLILFLFGDQWQTSANLAIILCMADILRTPTMLAIPSLIACGHIDSVLRSQVIVQTIFLLLLSLSIWLPLEHVVYCLVLARASEMTMYFRALNKHFGITLSQFWLNTRRSYLLVPFAAAGPIFLRIFTQLGQVDIPALLFLLLAGLLAAIGLVFGIFLIQHPLREEIHRSLPSFIKKKAGRLFRTAQKYT